MYVFFYSLFLFVFKLMQNVLEEQRGKMHDINLRALIIQNLAQDSVILENRAKQFAEYLSHLKLKKLRQSDSKQKKGVLDTIEEYAHVLDFSYSIISSGNVVLFLIAQICERM